MPELVPHYDQVCALVGDDDLAHCILSHYRLPPVVVGCSQAVWLGGGGPALVRNYDYSLGIVSEHFEMTSWFGRRVIAKAQRPWGGCLDGMNEDGLAVTTTFGGSQARGLGFSVILILRCVLETCRHVGEAVANLIRIPIVQTQNVTVLDRSGTHATVVGANASTGSSSVNTRTTTASSFPRGATIHRMFHREPRSPSGHLRRSAAWQGSSGQPQ
jgi:predicted choloylglycine hydrolase